jgi:hypothetical protein
MMRISKMCGTTPVLLTLVMTLSPGFAAERKSSLRLGSNLTAGDPVTSSGVLQVPVLGYAMRHSPVELRPILGIPQSAALGAPIPLPTGIADLSLAPRQDYALVQTGSARTVYLMPVGAGNTSDLVSIPGAFGRPDRVEFSPDGSVAALYSSQRQAVQLIGGMPASPRVIAERAAVVSWGAVSAMAVSDDGQAVLIGSSDGENGSVTLLPAGGAARTLLSVALPSALQFFSQTHDAVLADKKRNQILLLRDTTGTFAFSTLAVEVQGVGAPSEVEISSDQKYALVVNRRPKSLLVIEIASGSVNSLTCALAHSSVKRLARNAGLFTSRREDGTAWLIGTTRSDAQVSLLPDLAVTQRASE